MAEQEPDDVVVSGELRGLTAELQEAVRSHDRARLASLVADEFALAGSTSLGALDKQRWMDAAMAIEWRSFELLETQVTVHREVASVMHRMRQTATQGGEDISSTWLTIDTWWRSGNGWRIAGRCARRRADGS